MSADHFLPDDERLNLPGETLAKSIAANEAELGEIIKERFSHVFDGTAGLLFIFVGVFVAIFQFFHFSPIFSYSFALFAVVFGACHLRTCLKKALARRERVQEIQDTLKNYRNGMEGEVRLGMFLERIRNVDGFVIHDLNTGQGNIDHVVIAPWGVYTVEGKIRERKEGKLKVVYDGVAVTVNGFRDTASVIQGNAQMKLVDKVLKANKHKAKVQALLIFWGADEVDFDAATGSSLWVQNKKVLWNMIRDKSIVYLEARDHGHTLQRGYLTRDNMRKIAELFREWSLKGTDEVLRNPKL